MKVALWILVLLGGLSVACGDDPAGTTGTSGTPARPNPVNLSVFSGITTETLYLSWTAATGATNYRLESGVQEHGPFSLVADTTALYRMLGGLPAGETRHYRVIAEGPGGQSLSNMVRSGYTAIALPSALAGVTLVTNGGLVYSYDPENESKPSGDLVILTLNMHTYQETDQSNKFNTIAKLIADMDVDFIAFQENAQHKNSSLVYENIRSDNMCLVLTNLLKRDHGLDYYFTWDWAHYGWNVWEEGIAVMSKYPLLESESVWVSTSAATSSLVSRKAIHGRFNVPAMGLDVNLISTHLHWRTSLTDGEQNRQVNSVRALADAKTQAGDLTLVCGDYNSQPTEADPRWAEGYLTMVSNATYTDTFLACHPQANDLPKNPVYHTVGGDFPGRIDYIFMRTNAAFGVVSSQIIFTPAILGMVSDHYGVLTRIRKIP